MLATYSYKNGQGRRFKYAHQTDGDFYFQGHSNLRLLGIAKKNGFTKKRAKAEGRG